MLVVPVMMVVGGVRVVMVREVFGLPVSRRIFISADITGAHTGQSPTAHHTV